MTGGVGAVIELQLQLLQLLHTSERRAAVAREIEDSLRVFNLEEDAAWYADSLVGLLEQVCEFGQMYATDTDAGILIGSAVASLPDRVVLEVETLPAAAGLWLFDRPVIRLLKPDGQSRGVIGFVWMFADRFGNPAGAHTPDRVTIAFLSENVEGSSARPDLVGFAVWRLGQALSMHPKELRFLDMPVLGKLFLASMLFVHQRVLVQKRQTADRGQRRRYSRERAGLEPPPVTVVTLPRRQYGRGDAVPGSVDWQSRWAVSGHWRHQYRPSRDDHFPRYIHPYIKGPEDKPFRARPTTVYAVKPPPETALKFL